MKVTYNKPNNNNYEYKQWFDNNGTFDIWYKDAVSLYDYQNLDIPNELKMFLDKWNMRVEVLRKPGEKGSGSRIPCEHRPAGGKAVQR